MSGRKLIVQIPCYNEEQTLPATLRALPRAVPGFDVVEWLVIDDGSADRTSEVAAEHGVDTIVRLPRNQGLARAFIAGLEACLARGAHAIVNTDGDNQYRADGIASLVAPIAAGEADIVIGRRPISTSGHFSLMKKWLQQLGSFAVSIASGAKIPDATSGFRAFSREAASAMLVFNDFTYTLETLIQAGRRDFRIVSVPIEVNDPTRSSRLFRTNAGYVVRSIETILRVFILYKPLRFFIFLAILSLAPGILIGFRFLFHYFSGTGSGNIQSLILVAILIITAVLMIIAGILADLVATNRILLEDIRSRMIAADHREAGSQANRLDQGGRSERATAQKEYVS